LHCFDNISTLLHDTLDNLKDTNNPLSDTCWDHDFTSFLWHEFSSSQNLTEMNESAEVTMLGLKVRGYTPSIKR